MHSHTYKNVAPKRKSAGPGVHNRCFGSGVRTAIGVSSRAPQLSIVYPYSVIVAGPSNVGKLFEGHVKTQSFIQFYNPLRPIRLYASSLPPHWCLVLCLLHPIHPPKPRSVRGLRPLTSILISPIFPHPSTPHVSEPPQNK